MRGFYVAFLLFLSFSDTLYGQTQPVKPSSGGVAATATPPEKTPKEHWSLLSLSACGVDAFLNQHPEADGRGTIVCILDDGVDPGIAGLLKTSEGKTKIIDIQDFSATGDVFYTDAERKNDEIIVRGKPVLKGIDKLSITSQDGKYYYGFLPEKRFQNGLGDLNFNGSENDTFGIVIFRDGENHYSAAIDANANGDLSDENIVTTYKEKHDLFSLRAAKNSRKNDGRFLSGAVNIFPEEKRINLFFADGGHGTHVAGIAAGHDIDGQTGFNGVAPGAELVVLKFSDNTMGGVTVSGSMKKAYEYIIKTAKESGKPVIANMSFGIGSEIEGQSSMDKWLDSVLDEHPEVTVCISASNDGPGISNIGLPGSARSVITSGAALPDETGRDLYGVNMSKTIVWDFSSRGGELAKPDIVSPGTAISTVPDYVMGDRYNGTSMSSPYTTGACAVLISAMKERFKDYKPNSFLIKRALQLGAKPLDGGMTPLDQGAGLINIPAAYKILSDWETNHDAPKEYIIHTAVTNSSHIGTAAYYRNGFFPKGGERTIFTIRPQSSDTKTRESLLSFNVYDLRSDAPWLKAIQTSVYKRGEGNFQVPVMYDESLLTKPGIYIGKILAYAKEKGRPYPDFELWNTVVIPHALDIESNYSVKISGIAVGKEKLHREFILVPPACKAMKFTLSSQDPTTSADAVLVNDDGKTFAHFGLKKNDPNGKQTFFLTGERLEKGVIEVVVKRGLTNDDEPLRPVDLTVEAFPIDIEKERQYSLTSGRFSGSYSITNETAQELSCTPTVVVKGYEHYIDTLIKGTDSFTYSFSPRAGEHEIDFFVDLSREDYNQFTDIGLQILKADGNAVSDNAFDWRTNKIGYSFPEYDTNHYTLFFRGGYSVPDSANKCHLRIRERRGFKNELECSVNPPEQQTLYPMQSGQINYTSKNLPELPKENIWFGEFRLKIKDTDTIRIPADF
jgi:subtilisin family serine protease